jgi:hypothetical protein
MSALPAVRSLGLLHNDPLRGHVAVRTLDALLALPDDADGAGVATVVDGAALLSRTKLAAGGVLSTSVGVMRGRATVVQIGRRSDLRPSGLDQTLNLGPFRARSYAGAVSGGPADADAAAASRERLLRGLPDFLARCVSGRSEGEAFFLAVLAQVHRRGLLEATHDNAAALLEAIRDVAADDDASTARCATFTNGVVLLHVARHTPTSVISIVGLDDGVAASLDASLADSSTARERNRRYRGVVVVGGGVSPDNATPPGCACNPHGDDAAIVVGRDLVVRRI